MSEETVTDLADLGAVIGDAVSDTPAAPAAPTMPLRDKIVDAQGRAYATGRRKDAVARVWIKPGSGKITINGKESVIVPNSAIQTVSFPADIMAVEVNRNYLVDVEEVK